jgi:hypothetical protein
MLDFTQDRTPPGHKKLVPWSFRHRVKVANQLVDQADLLLEPPNAVQRTNWLWLRLRFRLDVLAGGFLCCQLGWL